MFFEPIKHILVRNTSRIELAMSVRMHVEISGTTYIREINLVLLLCQKMLKFMFELSLAEKGVSNSRGTRL